jgi:hypothetical protein
VSGGHPYATEIWATGVIAQQDGRIENTDVILQNNPTTQLVLLNEPN